LLEKSQSQLAEATTNERRVAEVFAHAYLASELEQNLIPADEAHETVHDHQATGSETWTRAVHAALMGLRAANERGFHLVEQTSTRP
jgi:hypothetical protein